MMTEALELEKQFWLTQAHLQFKLDVIERDGGVCVYPCQKPIQQVHHLLGRGKPRGWKGLPETIRARWIIETPNQEIFNPHVPINGRGLCLGHHVPFAHRFRPIVTKLLLLEILNRLAEDYWQGLTYAEYYALPPFEEYLR